MPPPRPNALATPPRHGGCGKRSIGNTCVSTPIKLPEETRARQNNG